MTIAQALNLIITKLNNKKIKFPHLEAEILLSEILKKPREFLLVHGEKKLTTRQMSNFKLKIYQRLKGLPIAYLTGHKEFYGLDFKINGNVLIPRPETELIIDQAFKLINNNSQSITLIDVGTGSGCIIITLAKLIKNYGLKITDFKLLGIDISRKALTVAKKNAKLNGVEKNIMFLQGNLLNPLFKNPKLKFKNSKLIILANLPYLSPNQIKNSPSIKHEPKLALTAGSDGLKYYRRLFKQIKKIRDSKHSIKDIYVLCEFDPRQTTKIKQLIKRELPKAELQIKKDLSGLNRLAIINFI